MVQSASIGGAARMDSLPNGVSEAGRTQTATASSPTRDADAILKMIRAQSILGYLPEPDLLALVRQSPVRTLPKNRVLFHNGDEGRSVVLILQGYVKLSTMAANGREVVLEIAGPGTL